MLVNRVNFALELLRQLRVELSLEVLLDLPLLLLQVLHLRQVYLLLQLHLLFVGVTLKVADSFQAAHLVALRLNHRQILAGTPLLQLLLHPVWRAAVLEVSLF